MSQPQPEYVIDLDHSLNRATIEGAQPGVPLSILVKAPGTGNATSIRATGARTPDGSEFQVDVPTPQGKQTHTWPWELLLAAIRARRRQ